MYCTAEIIDRTKQEVIFSMVLKRAKYVIQYKLTA